MHTITYSVIKRLPELTQETIIALKNAIAHNKGRNDTELCEIYCASQCPDGCEAHMPCSGCILHKPTHLEIDLLTVELFKLSL